jgi:hypothetical protein
MGRIGVSHGLPITDGRIRSTDHNEVVATPPPPQPDLAGGVQGVEELDLRLKMTGQMTSLFSLSTPTPSRCV